MRTRARHAGGPERSPDAGARDGGRGRAFHARPGQDDRSSRQVFGDPRQSAFAARRSMVSIRDEVLAEHGFDQQADRSARKRRRDRAGHRADARNASPDPTSRRQRQNDKISWRKSWVARRQHFLLSAAASRARRHGSGAQRPGSRKSRSSSWPPPGRAAAPTTSPARSQNIITKHKLTEQPIVVVNKGGGSGAEGYVYGKASAGDPYKVIFGTSNAWQQPLVFQGRLQLHRSHPDRGDGAGRVPALGQAGRALQDGGRLSEGRRRGRVQDGRRAVKGHRRGADPHDREGRQDQADLHPVQERRGDRGAARRRTPRFHVNNPSESLGQWRGGTQRPLCVFSPKRLPQGAKVTATEGWGDVPTCVEQGLDIKQYEQPRTVWLPGKVTPDQAAFYVDLMKKVQATPEWKDYIEKTSQVDTFLTGAELRQGSSRRISSTSSRSRASRAGSSSEAGNGLHRAMTCLLSRADGRAYPFPWSMPMISRRALGTGDRRSHRRLRCRRGRRLRASTTASAGRAAGVEAGAFPFLTGVILVLGSLYNPGAGRCLPGAALRNRPHRDHADRAASACRPVRAGRDFRCRDPARGDVRRLGAVRLCGAGDPPASIRAARAGDGGGDGARALRRVRAHVPGQSLPHGALAAAFGL